MLEVVNLTCGYGSKIVLHDISFNVSGGGFLGIIGPNGSGKTTLLRAISRLIKPKRGEIIFKKQNIWVSRLEELSKEIAVVSQSVPLNHMTGEDFVLLGRIPHRQRFQFLETKKDTETAQRSMALTDTLRFRDQFMDQISGGEKQLTIIARALAQEPKLFLLDEPTAHLDITHQVLILDLLRRLNKEEGITIIMVLHDLNLASEYCERLLLMCEGRVFKEGVPGDVLDYRNIEDVYKTVVIVKNNPISSKPYMLLVSEEERRKGRSQ